MGGRDVRVVQRSEHFGFPAKPGQPDGIEAMGAQNHKQIGCFTVVKENPKASRDLGLK
jgi:hypothetical protein